VYEHMRSETMPFDATPTTLRVGAYSVDPRRFAAIVERHPEAGELFGATGEPSTVDAVNAADLTRAATEWAVKQAVLRALGAPVRLRAKWPQMEVTQDEDGRWRVTSRGPVRQFHEAHTLGHVDVTVSEKDGRITAFAVLTRDVTAVAEPSPTDLPDPADSAGVNSPTDPNAY
jgi:phosphopantetheinyl transferase (holo-ACP synthase)